MRKTAILTLAILAKSSIAFSAQPGNWYDYGQVKVLISKNQDKLYQVDFYQDYTESEWTVCTHPIRKKVKITDVQYEGRKEIKLFTFLDPRKGKETIEIDLAPFPQAHKWILSTIIKKGASPFVTVRGCGSGGFTYLTSIDSGRQYVQE